MRRYDALAKTLAIAGLLLVALPLLAPLILGLISIGGRGGFRVDYLMPFEVYPVALVGVAMLLWASLRSHARRAAVGMAIAGMIAGLVLAAIAAQATGIANSVEQLETWKYVLTAGLAGISLLAQVALLVVGGLLVRDMVTAPGDTGSSATGAPDA